MNKGALIAGRSLGNGVMIAAAAPRVLEFIYIAYDLKLFAKNVLAHPSNSTRTDAAAVDQICLAPEDE